MNAWIIIGSIVVVIISLATSGLLYKIFVNVLMAAGIITLTAYILALAAGAILFFVVPFYCGATGKSLATVYTDLSKGHLSTLAYHSSSSSSSRR